MELQKVQEVQKKFTEMKLCAKLDVKESKAAKSVVIPYNYLAHLEGKGLRSKLMEAFNHWFNLDTKKLEVYKECVEILQNASLLVDDIEDNSLKRRGLPCAHIVYGVAATLNSANYYYFLVLHKLAHVTSPGKVEEMMKGFIKAIMDLHEGQAMDIYWRDNQIVPTLDEYRLMIDLKTTTLFRLAYLPLMIDCETDRKIDVDHLCYLVGQYFQIKDDYINLKCEEFHKLKGFADDISEGKFSFPIIHGIRNGKEEDTTILNILKMHTQDINLKKIVISLLEEAGSFEYTENVLQQLKDEIMVEMKKLDPNPVLEEMISKILQ